MKSTGVVRAIDQLGRIVLPVELRKNLNIEIQDPLEIYIEDDGKIILKKYEPACVFCDNATDVIQYKGKVICRDCLNDLIK